MKFNLRKIGVTLTELLVVVIIIGILATLALPMLVKTLERAKVGESVSNLNLIRAGQKIYFLEYGYFAGGSGGLDALNVENPNSDSSYFTYAIDTDAGDTGDFTGSAARKSDAPDDYEWTYYISKEGTITSDGPFFPDP